MYAIVYSATGNTKFLADKIKDTLSNKEDCLYCGSTCDEALKADRIYLGFWTNRGICDDISKEFIQKLSNQEVFIFGSAGFGNKLYLSRILKNTMSLFPSKIHIIGRFMCQGRMRGNVIEKYEKMMENKKTKSFGSMMMKNFEKSQSHPDDKDIAKLQKLILKKK